MFIRFGSVVLLSFCFFTQSYAAIQWSVVGELSSASPSFLLELVPVGEVITLNFSVDENATQYAPGLYTNSILAYSSVIADIAINGSGGDILVEDNGSMDRVLFQFDPPTLEGEEGEGVTFNKVEGFFVGDFLDNNDLPKVAPSVPGAFEVGAAIAFGETPLNAVIQGSILSAETDYEPKPEPAPEPAPMPKPEPTPPPTPEPAPMPTPEPMVPIDDPIVVGSPDGGETPMPEMPMEEEVVGSESPIDMMTPGDGGGAGEEVVPEPATIVVWGILLTCGLARFLRNRRQDG